MSDTVSKALDDLERARKNVKKITNRQVRNSDNRIMLRATALAWFHSHRPAVLKDAEPVLLSVVDEAYHVILRGADRNTQKTTDIAAMDGAKRALIELRSHLVVVNVEADVAPDFSPLTTDAE